MRSTKSFNPRAREGRDLKQQLAELEAEKVSIHAPVKGATSGFCGYNWMVDVSIHAPVKGATISATSRPVLLSVSIHAPVKGATDRAVFYSEQAASFNPRAREGRD